MSALEWLDAVRADLDAVSRFGHELDERVTSREGRSVLAIASDLDDAHNAIDNSAPDRLDRMERALRGVMGLAEAVRVGALIPTGCPVRNAGYRVAMDDVVTAIQEELCDE